MSDNPFQYDGEIPDELVEELVQDSLEYVQDSGQDTDVFDEYNAEAKRKNLITDDSVTSTVSGIIERITAYDVVIKGKGRFKITSEMFRFMRSNQWCTIHFDPKSRRVVSVEPLKHYLG